MFVTGQIIFSFLILEDLMEWKRKAFEIEFKESLRMDFLNCFPLEKKTAEADRNNFYN